MKDKPLIELQNVGTYNRGGYLMLLAIQQAFVDRGYGDKVLFCGEHGYGRNYFSLGANNMLQVPKVTRRTIPYYSVILPLIPQGVRRGLGIALPGEIDHVIDGAGFAYGDFWNLHKPSDSMLKTYSRVKKKGGKIILVPQALGPFTKPEVIANFKKVIDAADLICARDNISYQNLIDAFGDRPAFVQFPDFTNLLETPAAREYPEGNVCIIPNYKMFSKEGTSKETYIYWLTETIKAIQDKGKRPYWLIHEGKGDMELAVEVNNKLDSPLTTVEHPDPLHLKHRIKGADFIVVSRFHGLVSSLSQSIPAITTSWSHKYQMVADEYGVGDFLVDVYAQDAVEVTGNLVDILSDDKQRNELKESLKVKAAKQKERTRSMWDKVFAHLAPFLPDTGES